METGQPSYPESSGRSAGAMYQDPNTIQRQAAPTGDLYAQPYKPTRHSQKQQTMELPLYQDPSTIERQAVFTGDKYALLEKKKPSGPALALYTEVDRTNQVKYLIGACSTFSVHVHVLLFNVHHVVKNGKISRPCVL